MSLFFGRGSQEQRAISYGDLWSTGGDVTMFSAESADKALRLVPVYAAWRLIGDQVSSLPLRAYRRAADGSKQMLPAQPALMMAPTAYGSVFDWKQRCIVSLLSRGNAVGYVTQRNGLGYPSMIEWLNPDDIDGDALDQGEGWFYKGRALDPMDVVHIPAMVMPGKRWGVSPLKAFKTTFETGQAAQTSARDWFANGAIPAAHVKNTARTIDASDADTVKKRYKQSVKGRDVLVTGADWTVDVIGIPADEARFIETLKLTATQVASIYGIPPEMIGGETGSSLTYSTVELNSINFVTYTLRPWLVRIEETLSALLPQPQYVKFNVDALIRADTESRMRAHEIALRIGMETQDEGRALEDKPPLTPDEKAEWQQSYAKSSAQAAAGMPADPQAARGYQPVEQARAVVEFKQGETPPPVVNVTVEPTPVTIVNEVAAPVVNVEPTPIELAVAAPAPEIRVEVQPAEVTVIEADDVPTETTTVFERDADGFVVRSRSVERPV